eukprot:COSAG02_NODE_1033_length_15063_cov_14.987503_5_plen_141_part_00
MVDVFQTPGSPEQDYIYQQRRRCRPKDEVVDRCDLEGWTIQDDHEQDEAKCADHRQRQGLCVAQDRHHDAQQPHVPVIERHARPIESATFVGLNRPNRRSTDCGTLLLALRCVHRCVAVVREVNEVMHARRVDVVTVELK